MRGVRLTDRFGDREARVLRAFSGVRERARAESEACARLAAHRLRLLARAATATSLPRSKTSCGRVLPYACWRGFHTFTRQDCTLSLLTGE